MVQRLPEFFAFSAMSIASSNSIRYCSVYFVASSSMSFSHARYWILATCDEEIVLFVSSVLATCGESTVGGGWWVVLSLESVGGGVLGTAGDWAGSCVSGPDVLVGGVGFGEGAGVLLPCPRGVGIGLWVPVLIPCFSGDLLRDGGVCVPGLTVFGESLALRFHRLVDSFVSGSEELAVEAGCV